MHCTACGKQIADNVSFCPYCGKPTPQGTGTAGGLGALKIGLIAFGSVAVVGLGTFGATQIASRFAGDQETSIIEDVVDQTESEIVEEAETVETETLEEPNPIDEALEQYRIIISQADSYDYGEYAEADQSWEEFIGYRYALVQMQPYDPVPTLLLEWGKMDTELSVPLYYARVFQYDSDTKTVHQPTEAIGDGGIRGGLSMAGDGYGISSLGWSGGTGMGSAYRILLDGDSLIQEIYWSDRIDRMPDTITFTEIEWHEIEDLSALDNWTAPDSNGLSTDGDRIVLTGTVGTYDYDEIIELQGQADPDAEFYDDYSRELNQSMTYRVILLDMPQTLRLHSGGDDGYSVHEALMFNLYYADGMDRYEGKHITFSIDPATSWWPGDTSLPLGQPFTSDIHILD